MDEKCYFFAGKEAGKRYFKDVTDCHLNAGKGEWNLGFQKIGRRY